MEPKKLIPFGPPFYPATIDPGSWTPPRSYYKSSKFTQSILTHGRWSNTTLDEATNLREREQRLKERTMRQMSRMSDKIRWEVQELDRIQKQVRARQHRIAQANLCACCAIMIQAAWRTYQAKMLARERRGRKLGQMLTRWWRCIKIRRNVAVIKRFVIAAVSRRRRRAQRRLNASVKLQRAWRRYTLRMVLGRGVLATAATEMFMDEVLVEIARRVFMEITGAIIARAWKKSKRRMENKGRKGRSGRVFLTQGGVSSPRRKSPRAGGPRSGVASDPSSSYSSRRPPSLRPGANRRKPSVTPGFTSPSILNIVSAATSAVAAGTTSDGDRRGSSQSGDPPPPSSCRNTKDDASGFRRLREKSGASATSETEGDNGGGEGREPPKPKERLTSSATRSPDDAVRRVGSPKSEASSSNGGDGGGRFIGERAEDVVVDVVVGRKTSLNKGKDDMVVERATVPQPRRPSGAKPSRTSEGRSSRPHRLTSGKESESHRPPSATPDNSSKSLQLVTAGERGTAAGSTVVLAEASSTTTVADTRPGSVGQSDPRSRGVADRIVDGVGPRGDGFGGDDDDLGHGDKVFSLVGRSELGEPQTSKEDYASDTFESLDGLSLTQ